MIRESESKDLTRISDDEHLPGQEVRLLSFADKERNPLWSPFRWWRQCACLPWYPAIMQSKATSVSEYLQHIPDDQRDAFLQVRKVILDHLPAGFVECMNYGMIGYVVPHSIYPTGYHCDPTLPLPFAWLAYQKNSINLYHMGIYANPKLLTWFQDEYQKQSTRKLDMGKSCMRFKHYDDIPYSLIGKLFTKISVKDRITLYETSFKKGKK